MKPSLRENGVINSLCPDCGFPSSFPVFGQHIKINKSVQHNDQAYSWIFYLTHQCVGCQRGGLSKIYSHSDSWGGGQLVSFFPYSREVAKLPPDTPNDIVAEFREAELCTSFEAYRAASALFRSTLEKVLKANGYEQIGKKGFDVLSLQNKIDQAQQDGVLTEARRKRAHDDIRSLGNDVLHDDWREIAAEEVEAAHHYTQRIIEDFYDNRKEVEAVLIAKNRITVPVAPSVPSSSPSSGTGS